MSNAEQEHIRQAVAEAIEATKRTHQQWHWDTGQTDCPWGCGDGSGIVGP